MPCESCGIWVSKGNWDQCKYLDWEVQTFQCQPCWDLRLTTEALKKLSDELTKITQENERWRRHANIMWAQDQQLRRKFMKINRVSRVTHDWHRNRGRGKGSGEALSAIMDGGVQEQGASS